MAYKEQDRKKVRMFSVKTGIYFSKIMTSPNKWTLVSLIPAILAFYFLINERFLLTAIMFVLFSFLDLVDGSVARVTGKVTKLGAYLDTIVDRYVEAIIIFGLLFASLPNFIFPIYIWVFLALFGAMMTTYAKSATAEKELMKEHPGSFFDRAERLVLLFVGILLAIVDPLFLSYILVLFAILTNLSALQRIKIAVRSTKE
ncbi:MAG: CDP-alcohol phosphatidyltransferase family protein [Candidatus Aenigmarchaeota archaeon]|nr:CDP-alcohol phosphatidyltransferase family protein [Candidatus Aenigmarchaeota archaeon]